MIDDDESIRRFRSVVPPPSEAAWAAVRGAVAREIEAELERPHANGRMTRRWSPRLIAGVLGALCFTGAAAYGATSLIGVGSPAPNPLSIRTPARIKLLGLRVADPGGGVPWGIRLALSRPGGIGHKAGGPNVEIQLGRIRGGQMGFIGSDNAFNDDGLFHVAGPNSALISPANYPIPGTPQKPDLGSVHHFALTLPGVASASKGCSNVRVPLKPTAPFSKKASAREVHGLERFLGVLDADGPAARRDARQQSTSVAALRSSVAEELEQTREEASGYATERTFATCPARDLRTIIIGFAGPTTTSITINGLGTQQTEKLGPDDDGFYLFVLAHKWSYASRYHATVTCSNGHTDTGLAAAGTPDAPRCPV